MKLSDELPREERRGRSTRLCVEEVGQMLNARSLQTMGITRQRLLAQVRSQSEQLRRRAERSGIFSPLALHGLAKAELQRYLQEDMRAEAPSQCLILLACAVHGGAVISIDVL
jgi:transposase